MIKNGLNKIKPDRRDYSLLHTFGALQYDTKSLPADFSIYDGSPIPNQNALDTRFSPAIRPLPLGCTGETQTFAAMLQDGQIYPPDDLYFATPPYTDMSGRDLRASLQATIDHGFKLPDGTLGAKRTAYVTCYGAGKIDDFDAARIGIYLNAPIEKRSVSIGTFWYPEFENPDANGSLPIPSFDIRTATLHNWLATGWRTLNGIEELQVLSWQGGFYGKNGVVWMSRALYNALMAQPYTGSYQETKLRGNTPVPIGIQAYIDHVVYFILHLYQFI